MKIVQHLTPARWIHFIIRKEYWKQSFVISCVYGFYWLHCYNICFWQFMHLCSLYKLLFHIFLNVHWIDYRLMYSACWTQRENIFVLFCFEIFKALSLSIHFKLRKRKSSEFVDLFPASKQSFGFWTWRDLELLCLVSIQTKTCWFFFYIVVTFVLAPFFSRDRTGFLYCQVVCCLHVS